MSRYITDAEGRLFTFDSPSNSWVPAHAGDTSNKPVEKSKKWDPMQGTVNQ